MTTDEEKRIVHVMVLMPSDVSLFVWTATAMKEVKERERDGLPQWVKAEDFESTMHTMAAQCVRDQLLHKELVVAWRTFRDAKTPMDHAGRFHAAIQAIAEAMLPEA